MKRKISSEDDVCEKKNKNINEWVSSTEIRNYILNDPLVDWLKLYSNTNRDKSPFTDFILKQGIDFEKAVVEVLKTKLPLVFIGSEITDQTCQMTIDAIRRGVPLIYSAPFRNNKNKTHGIMDILIRSDFLHFFSDYKYKASIPHYVVIDIKFSTIPLRADGIHILNDGNYKAYKAQLRIYTEALEELQNYIPTKAFIFGRRWNYISKGENYFGSNCFDKLGVIDYTGVDKNYIEETKIAIEWIREVRLNGFTWSIDPPSRKELYPNMCVDSGEWNNVKKEIASKIGDITQVWYCGVKNRDIAFSKGIKSWKDKKCTSKTMGITGNRSFTIDKMLLINRQERDKIRPTKIENNLYGWKESSNEIFVDFETFCDIFSPLTNLYEQVKTDNIFMIGIWYKNENEWIYKNFLAKNRTLEAEFEIMQEFIEFLKERNYPKLWYWHAESSIWNRSENRQMDIAVNQNNFERADHIVCKWKNLNWCDLCQIFREEPIVLKGCFKFGLKEISSAMKNHGFIETEIESKCNSGLDASVLAWKAYDNNNSTIMKDIELYNKFDVKVLYEILNFLRTMK